MKSKSIIALALVIFVVGVFYFNDESKVAQGLTLEGHYATTTAGNAVYGSFTTGRLIKTGYGYFDKLVITGANTGVLNFYDATTTDITKRTGNTSTSSILIASVPASAAAGNYLFNTALVHGLYVDLVSGTMPTSTISYD